MQNHPTERSEETGRASILVIDDEEAVRGLFRAILEPVGYRIREAVDGREGIRCFRKSPTDLVITDMSMPYAGGLDVIRELRADFPALKILAVSGSKRPEEFSEARPVGADAMLGKPVGVDELRAVVEWLLRSPRQGA